MLLLSILLQIISCCLAPWITMLLIRCWYTSGLKSNIKYTFILRTKLIFQESQNIILVQCYAFQNWIVFHFLPGKVLSVCVCVSACVCLADEWVVCWLADKWQAGQTEVAHKVMNTTYHWESHLKVHTVLTWKLRYTHFSQYTNLNMIFTNTMYNRYKLPLSIFMTTMRSNYT